MFFLAALIADVLATVAALVILAFGVVAEALFALCALIINLPFLTALYLFGRRTHQKKVSQPRV